ncbi:MAG: phosphotransferase enzyme family protein [Micromonosporaceae bacterium]
MTAAGLSHSSPPIDLDRIVATASRHAGLPSGASEIRHFANAVYLLDAAPVVARVAYGPHAVTKSQTGIAVTRWLVGQGFPATAPVEIPSGRPQPIIVRDARRDVAVTFWRYYPQPTDAGAPASDELGRITKQLHRLAPPDIALPEYRPLRSLQAVLRDPIADAALGAQDRAWLVGRATDLCAAYDEMHFPLGTGFIHADVYVGNLLWDLTGNGHRVVLGDWDSACIGPREIDLVATYQEPRFGEDPAEVQAFADGYGYDLASWRGYPTLMDIRDLSTLTALIRLAPQHTGSAAELAHRLHTLKRGDRVTHWNGQ